jgi:hypothetical protein
MAKHRRPRSNRALSWLPNAAQGLYRLIRVLEIIQDHCDLL